MWNNSYYIKPYKLSGDSIIDGIFYLVLFFPRICSSLIFFGVIAILVYGINLIDSDNFLILIPTISLIIFIIFSSVFLSVSNFSDAYFNKETWRYYTKYNEYTVYKNCTYYQARYKLTKHLENDKK